MSRPLRIVLILLGLLIICCSVITLIYLNIPTDLGSIQATLEPTLFISP